MKENKIITEDILDQQKISDYFTALKNGTTENVQMTGLVGRIIRGKKPEDFTTLTDDPERKIIMVMGADGLDMLLGKTGYESLVAIGNEETHLRKKILAGNKFNLVVFPEQNGALLATWDNLVSLASQQYPESADILYNNLEQLKLLPSPAKTGWSMELWKKFEKQSGFDWGEVDELGPNHPQYMTTEKLLQSKGDVVAARAFVYFTLHCRELFGGDGKVYDKNGNKSMSEYICPNIVIRTLPKYGMEEIEVEIPKI